MARLGSSAQGARAPLGIAVLVLGVLLAAGAITFLGFPGGSAVTSDPACSRLTVGFAGTGVGGSGNASFSQAQQEQLQQEVEQLRQQLDKRKQEVEALKAELEDQKQQQREEEVRRQQGQQGGKGEGGVGALGAEAEAEEVEAARPAKAGGEDGEATDDGAAAGDGEAAEEAAAGDAAEPVAAEVAGAAKGPSKRGKGKASSTAGASEIADSSSGAASSAAGASSGYGGALPLEPPKGYQLPPECAKHTVLYGGIYADLAPFMKKPGGITEADLKACNIPYGKKDDQLYFGDLRRLLLHANKLYTLEAPWTNASDPGGGRGHMSGQHQWQLLSIQEAAQRWGLPDIEFAMGLSDVGHVNERGPNGTLCPMLSMAKSAAQFDLLVPEGQFVEYQMDKWVREEDPFPWEEKIEKAIARFTYFCPYSRGTPDRYGGEATCARAHYMRVAATNNDTLDVQCNACPTDILKGLPGGTAEDGGPPNGLTSATYIPLSKQRKWKYALDTDGWGPALRFYKLLGGGWTILKDISPEHLWFFPALQPWVHYIPVRWNGPDEVVHVIRWLRKNDHVARTVARNAKQFARSHLTDEGRLCYIKVLFEELAALYSFKKAPGDYERAVLVEEELSHFDQPQKTNI